MNKLIALRLQSSLDSRKNGQKTTTDCTVDKLPNIRNTATANLLRKLGKPGKLQTLVSQSISVVWV